MSEHSTEPTILELTVGPVAHGGHCVARHEGRVIFVRHAIPGERIRARLSENDAESKFWRADTVEVLEASQDRVEHFWPAADALIAASRGTAPIGGAEFGHISRGGQLALKRAVVAEQLKRLGGLTESQIDSLLEAGVEDVDVDGSDEQQAGLAWRTRVSFAVDSSGKLGMHAFRSHDILPVTSMPLADERVNELGLWDIDFTGIERVDVVTPAASEEILVLLAPKAGASEKAAGLAIKRVARAISANAKQPSVLRWDPKTGQTSVIVGRGWVKERVATAEFRVSGDGFWQIHRRAPEVLSASAMEFLHSSGVELTGAHVADLYAGAGLFTAPLARAVGSDGSVLSVEGYPSTSRDARKNLHAATQVRIVQGKVERVLGTKDQGGKLPRFEAVVLDPPRAGAGKGVVKQIVNGGAKAVVYVACDPAAFARDVKYFNNAGWEIEKLRAFDLYPHTHHVETVALLRPAKATKE